VGFSLAGYCKKMKEVPTYDVAIIGGGLAGLAAAILLRRSGHSVVVLEKESFPHHKVCGEYVSRESWNFLSSLGLPLSQWDLPLIDSLVLTAPSGTTFTARLPLGGFGISRYRLDSELALLARESGVVLLEETKVEEAKFGDEVFHLSFHSRRTAEKSLQAKLACGAFGKRSNLDVRWNREHLQKVDRRLDNYVGVKYHLQANWPADEIGLHNFPGGYCGISRIEDGRYCLCYMTRAQVLKDCGNSVAGMEEKVLFQNPHLKRILESSTVLESFPVTISQIGFRAKSQVENHLLMLGDAAGMITPLCGNGMSIALHTAKLAATHMDAYLNGKEGRAEMEAGYAGDWKNAFSRRLRTGRLLQSFFGGRRLSNAFVGAFRTFPFLASPVIRMTHGEPF
jgi:flavin-dependent dehydrogenase